ncbi:MAG: geranylgeranylglyceryl/heptaprenylglyceryl phosphate synthase [Candidatus Aenigmatarchaeota archaeon]|nr:MAG: geranylgeranylglyceryl/heptaprenylglyceryl phosphate synthase [Candidatus Aenigmarchaeota archaeon]
MDGRVFNYIKDKRKSSTLHFTLIDPDKQEINKAVELAKKVEMYGSDAIMVGGSQPTSVLYLDSVVKGIKSACSLPVILFPSSHSGISRYADAIFFMSLFNSTTTQYIIDEQMRGSVLVKAYGLEPLPMAYLIIESGTKTSAGFGGNAKEIPRDRPGFAVGYALAAKYFGMKFVYLEAGSGAKYSVPEEMIRMVKDNIGDDMFLIVGGGIRDAETAERKIEAGADIIVTGTIAENNEAKLREIINKIKEK